VNASIFRDVEHIHFAPFNTLLSETFAVSRFFRKIAKLNSAKSQVFLSTSKLIRENQGIVQPRKSRNCPTAKIKKLSNREIKFCEI